jgi:hypothetical protein
MPSPLVEIYVSKVDTSGITNLEIERLLQVFECQPLRKLILFDIPDLDVALLWGIVTTFPQLEELVLFTDDSRVPWSGGLVRLIGNVLHEVYLIMFKVPDSSSSSKFAKTDISGMELHRK